MDKMLYWWVLIMIIGMIMRSDILVAVSIICINMHYIASEIINSISENSKKITNKSVSDK